MFTNGKFLIFWVIFGLENCVELDADFFTLRKQLTSEIEINNLTEIKNIIEEADKINITILDFINRVDETESTRWRIPLHQAAWENNLMVVEYLVSIGADINRCVQSPSDAQKYYTPLGITAEKNYPEIAKYLLGKGASTALVLHGSKSNTAYVEQAPLSLAAKFNSTAIVDLILEYKGEFNFKDTYGRSPLYFAIEKGNVEIIKKLLKAGAKIKDINDWRRCGALHVALMGDFQNKEEVIKLLLAEGADVEKRDVIGETPLYFAIRRGYEKVILSLLNAGAKFYDGKYLHSGTGALFTALNTGLQNKENVIKLLLEKGASTEEVNYHGRTPLYVAIEEGNVELISILLHFGAKIDVIDDWQFGYGSLHVAVRSTPTQNKERVIKLLLDKGADVEKKDKKGRTPLFYAVENGYIEVITILLNSGANINIVNDDGYGALHVALEKLHRNKEEVVKLLLEKGADVGRKDSGGRCALYLAIKEGNIRVISILINAGARVNDVNDVSGLGPLHVATQYTPPQFKKQVIKQLLDGGADKEKKNNAGSTPIKYALELSEFEVAKVLYEVGAYLDPSFLNDISGCIAPLYLKVREGDLKGVLYLLGAHANIRARSSDMNYTALHALAYAERNIIGMLGYLIDFRAEKEAKDIFGLTPLALAILKRNFEASIALIVSGAHFDLSYLVNNSTGFTALFEAVEKGHAGLVEKFLEVGANVSASNGEMEYTVLHAVTFADNNIKQLIEILLRRGAQIERVNKEGTTPLQLAIKRRNFEATRIFIEKGARLYLSYLKKYSDGFTPLFEAVKKGEKEVVSSFLDVGADVTSCNGNMNYTVLHAVAFAKNNTEMLIQLLLKKGTDVEKKDSSFRTPLKLAIEQNNTEAIGAFIRIGAYVDSPFFYSKKTILSPLFEAVEGGDIEQVELFFKYYSNVTRNNVEMDYTVLHAITYANESIKPIIELLLNKSASIEEKDRFGLTPLEFAIIRRNFEVSKVLVKNGAQFNFSFLKKNYKGITPLFDAAKEGDKDMVDILLDAGANVTAHNGDKELTVLHAVAYARQNIEPIIETLLMKGAKIDKKDKDGVTPLKFAILKRNFKATEILISKGAILDPSYLVKNGNENTPLFDAIRADNKKMVELFLNASADVLVTNGDMDYSALHAIAFANQNEEAITKLLVAKGADLEKEDWLYRTPLKFAIELENFEAVKTLYENGAKLHLVYLERKSDGFTPLFDAVEKGDVDLVRIFLDEGADVTMTNGDMGYTVLHAAVFLIPVL